MKKIISIILVIVMAAAISMPIFAEDSVVYGSQTADGNYGSVVVYGVTETFTLTIPDHITFTDSSLYTTGEIVAENILLSTGQTLTVTVSSQNGWIMIEKEQSTVTLAYTMALTQDGTHVGQNATVFSAIPQEEGLTKKQTLHCKRDATNQAGTYEDTLTFTSQVIKSN